MKYIEVHQDGHPYIINSNAIVYITKDNNKAKIFLNQSKGLGQINTDESYESISSAIENDEDNQ